MSDTKWIKVGNHIINPACVVEILRIAGGGAEVVFALPTKDGRPWGLTFWGEDARGLMQAGELLAAGVFPLDRPAQPTPDFEHGRSKTLSLLRAGETRQAGGASVVPPWMDD